MTKVTLFAGVAFNVAAQCLLKVGMKAVGPIDGTDLLSKIGTMVSNGFVILGIVLYGIGFFLYSIVLSRMELSVAYPVASVSAIILISVISFFLFKEAMNPVKILGMALCVAGIFFVFK
jgi:multidrug transporter EmrE-like cation transporter